MSLSLTPAARSAFDRLAADLNKVFGTRLVALVAYTPRASVAFARDLRSADFDALAVLVDSWHREGLDTPLVMAPDEFTRSLDAFPLEYQAILDQHAVIAGTPPFAGVRVDPGDLRRGCEVQAKAHLIHLRQGWLQARGHAAGLADLAQRSAAPFRVLLSHVASLSGQPSDSTDSLVAFADRTVGMPADLVRAVLELEHQPQRRTLPGGFAAYVGAADRLWSFVDAWHA